jgi:hypothetical protein
MHPSGLLLSYFLPGAGERLFVPHEELEFLLEDFFGHPKKINYSIFRLFGE